MREEDGRHAERPDAGIEATRQLLATQPHLKIIILTSLQADNNVIQALQAGAVGYVLKTSSAAAIISDIIAVMGGERVMASAVAKQVIDLLTGGTTAQQFYDGLTSREIEILTMISAGKPNKQIAYLLKISEKTVRNHISNIYEKLGIYDRSQAVLYAVRKGLVSV